MSNHTTFQRRPIARDEVLSAMERFDQEMRSGYPQKRWKTYAIEYSGKLYPPKDTMRLVVGYEDIGSGGEPVNSKFEELGFKIVTIGEPAFPQPVDAVAEALETSISLERDLEDYLTGSLSQLEPGLRLYSSEGGSARQFDTKTVGIIDILAVDPKGTLVVVELKAGEADERVCGQIQRYMGWVKASMAGPRSVRGIIVASSFSENLRFAIKVVPAISIKRYSVSFKFAAG